MMTLYELAAVINNLRLFRYRPEGEEEWRSAFYDPKKQRDPKAWLEQHDIAIAEIDMRPSQQPPDVSPEAWDYEQWARRQERPRRQERVPA